MFYLKKYLERLEIEEMNFNIEAFNGVWWCFILALAACIILLTLLLKNKSIKVKKITLLSIAIFNLLFWVVYKYWLYLGVEELLATGYHFVLLEELPLQLCSISLFLVIFAILFNNKPLYSYCFYVSVLGATMALIAPAVGFSKTSIFSLHNIGFYGTHGLLIVVAVATVSTKLYTPSLKDVPRCVFVTFGLASVMHLLNTLFNEVFGVNTYYFYTYGPKGIGLLELFYSWIPIKFLFLLPSLAVLAVYISVVSVPFTLKKIMNKKSK